MSQPKQAPTINTTNYLFFGRVDVVMKAATGGGIVTSIVLQSDDQDEIDWVGCSSFGSTISAALGHRELRAWNLILGNDRNLSETTTKKSRQTSTARETSTTTPMAKHTK